MADPFAITAAFATSALQLVLTVELHLQLYYSDYSTRAT